ncbi:MAG: Histone acetyltransferase HPA2 and related acetyltransferases [uncultured Rubrobacteraceae bacterium]|uniref:Histone acetyltransferase HPA2 and related acetyltransferases n=1 Tax=uncultured Rubrobacteraceae bacterium TaxID=349277 RepID=A0A6J4PTG4_9ACTN|nr:MAG: Histone acetyltransferase HPA2 and related acetyltransferases [uncultured Rubrobacteraceae bacterium]
MPSNVEPGPRIEARPVAPDELAEPLSLLEEFLRKGEPVPPLLAGRVARAVETGDIEVLAARTEPNVRPVGVAVLAFRPSVSAGALFASIEDLYVSPAARGRGAGRALLEAVEERCRARGASYVEVQTDEEAAPFYEASGYEPEPGVRVLSRSHYL